MTLRKTLIGALASFLLLTAFSATAVAQDDTTTETATATPTPTPTETATATDTTASADSTAGLAGAPTGAEDSGIAAAFGVETPNPQPSVPLTPVSPDAAADAATAPAADAAAATAPAAADATAAAPAAGADPAAAAQDTAQNQLAFTGPDTRVAALAFTLLGLGAAFTAASRRRNDA